MTGPEQNVNTEVQEAQNKEQFEKNLANIKSILDNKKDLSNELISPKLDTAFLNQLEKNKDNKKQDITDLYDKTSNLLVNQLISNPAPTLNEEDVKALKDLQNFLKPYVYTKVDIDLKKTDKGTKEKYNNNESITQAKNKLSLLTYIPEDQKTLVQSFLDDPSKENIQNLQKFILDQSKGLSGFNRIEFYKGSFDKNFSGKEQYIDDKKSADGKFGPETLVGFNAFMDVYNNYFKDFKDSENEAKKIAKENDTKNTQAEIKKNIQEQKKSEEKNIDKKAEKAIDDANLAGVLTSLEVAKLQAKTLEIDDYNNVVYRGEKIPFADLGIARTKSIQTTTRTGLSNTDLVGQNQSQEISNEMILDYLNGKNNSGLIGIDNIASDQIMQKLATKKLIIDNKVDEQLRNPIIYDEGNNEYKYRLERISRDDILEGKTTLQQRQNQVDRINAIGDNPERIVNTQTSTDGSTNRKTIDLAGDKGQKIIINKENTDGSTTKTVDAVRGDNSKVVTTQRDSQGNISNESKIKEDNDSFKEKEKNITMPTGKELEPRKVEARATSDDVYNAINKHMKNDPSIAFNYDVIKNGDTIRIQLSDNGGEALGKNEFQNAFKKALSDAGILQIDMQNYKFKGEKVGNNEKVDKLVFKVGLDSKKQTPNTKESAKFDEVTPDIGRQEIPNGQLDFLYARVGTQKTLYARQQADRVVKTFAKFDGKEWIYDIKEEDPNIKTIQEQTKQQK